MHHLKIKRVLNSNPPYYFIKFGPKWKHFEDILRYLNIFTVTTAWNTVETGAIYCVSV